MDLSRAGKQARCSPSRDAAPSFGLTARTARLVPRSTVVRSEPAGRKRRYATSQGDRDVSRSRRGPRYAASTSDVPSMVRTLARRGREDGVAASCGLVGQVGNTAVLTGCWQESCDFLTVSVGGLASDVSGS